MKFNGCRFFFLLIILILPLSSIAAGGFYAPGYYQPAGQFQRGFSRVRPYAIPHIRPNGYRGYGKSRQWPTNYPPVARNHYQGYQFRPYQPNYRYRPTFKLPPTNYQMASYRWRPIHNQRQAAQWQGNYRRMPIEPVWKPIVSNQRAAYFAGNSWGKNPRYPQHNGDYADRLHYRPMTEATPKYVAGYSHRPMNISIPDHYVYRPMNTKPQNTLVRNDLELITWGIESDRAAMQRVAEVTQFRSPQERRNRSTGNWDKLSASWSRPGFRMPYNASPQPWQHGRFRDINSAATLPQNKPYLRHGYMGRHALSQVPEGRSYAHVSVAAYSPDFTYYPSRFSSEYSQQHVPLTYAGFRDPQPTYVHTKSRANWYDGQTDRQGAWYKSLQLDSLALVSQANQEEYALMGYKRINY